MNLNFLSYYLFHSPYSSWGLRYRANKDGVKGTPYGDFLLLLADALDMRKISRSKAQEYVEFIRMQNIIGEPIQRENVEHLRKEFGL